MKSQSGKGAASAHPQPSASRNALPHQLNKLKDSYDLAMLRLNEMSNPVAGAGAENNLFAKAHGAKAAKVYNALSSLLYTSIAVSKIDQLESFVKETAISLPATMIDLDEWEHVLTIARECREQLMIQSIAQNPQSVQKLATLMPMPPLSHDVRKRMQLLEFLAVNPIRNTRAEVAQLRASAVQELTALQGQYAHAMKLIFRVVQQMKDMQNVDKNAQRVHQLKQQVHELQKQLDSQRAQSESSMTEVQRQRKNEQESAVAEIAQRDQQIHKLEQALERERQRVSQLSTALTQSENAFQSLTSEHKALIEKQQSTAATLQQEIVSANAQRVSHQSVHSALAKRQSHTLEAVTHERDALRLSSETLRQEYDALVDAEAQLNAHCTRLQEECTSLQETQRVLQVECEKLQRECESLSNTRDTLQSSLSELRDSHSQLSESHGSLGKAHEEVVYALSNASRNESELRVTRERLESTQRELQLQLNELEQRAERGESRSIEVAKELAECRVQLEEAAQETAAVKAALDDERSENANLLSAKSRLETALTDAQTTLSEQSREIDELRHDKVNLLGEKDRLVSALDDVTAELCEHKRVGDDLRQTNAELLDSKERLEKNAEDSNAQFSEQMRERESISAREGKVRDEEMAQQLALQEQSMREAQAKIVQLQRELSAAVATQSDKDSQRSSPREVLSAETSELVEKMEQLMSTLQDGHVATVAESKESTPRLPDSVEDVTISAKLFVDTEKQLRALATRLNDEQIHSAQLLSLLQASEQELHSAQKQLEQSRVETLEPLETEAKESLVASREKEIAEPICESDAPQESSTALTVAEKQQEIDELRVTMTALRTEVDSSQALVTALNKQLKELSKTNENNAFWKGEQERYVSLLRAELETQTTELLELRQRVSDLDGSEGKKKKKAVGFRSEEELEDVQLIHNNSKPSAPLASDIPQPATVALLDLRTPETNVPSSNKVDLPLFSPRSAAHYAAQRVALQCLKDGMARSLEGMHHQVAVEVQSESQDTDSPQTADRSIAVIEPEIPSDHPTPVAPPEPKAMSDSVSKESTALTAIDSETPMDIVVTESTVSIATEVSFEPPKSEQDVPSVREPMIRRSNSSMATVVNQYMYALRIQKLMRQFLARARVRRLKMESLVQENGLLLACDGTVQGQTGWYRVGQQMFYFCLDSATTTNNNNGSEFVMLCGPISKQLYEIAVDEIHMLIHQFQQMQDSNLASGFPSEGSVDSLASLSSFKYPHWKLPRNICIDRLALQATRVQIETLLEDLRQRDEHIARAEREVQLLKTAVFGEQAETIAKLNKQLSEYMNLTETLQKEKEKLLFKTKGVNDEALNQLQSKVDVLKESEIESYMKLTSAVRGFLARKRVNQLRSLKLANETGVLVAMDNTTQGQSGWYAGPQGSIFYFVQKDGRWTLAAGPLTQQEFETSFLQVSREYRKAPPGKLLVKCAFNLSGEHDHLMKDSQLFMSSNDGKLFLALPVDDVVGDAENDLDFPLEGSNSLFSFSESKFGDSISSYEEGNESSVGTSK